MLSLVETWLRDIFNVVEYSTVCKDSGDSWTTEVGAATFILAANFELVRDV